MVEMTTLPKFYNLVRMNSASTGDSDIILTTAVAGCKTFADAGVSDSEDVNYGLITYSLTTRQPVGSETGLGKYISSGTVFKRTTVESSTDSDNSAIDLTGITQIYITPPASRLNGFLGPFAVYYGSSSDVSDGVDNSVIALDTEWVDQMGIASVSGNSVTVVDKGLYLVHINVIVTAASPFNGRVNVVWNGYGSNVQLGFTTAMGIQSTYIQLGPTYFNAANDNTNLDTVTISNHLGVTITPSIDQFIVMRIGNSS